MASFGHQMPQRHAPQHQGYSAHPGAAAAPGQGHRPGGGAPAGTFSPGTKIQVGSHRVVIQKYLSEGGFAHVYLVKLPSPVDGTDLAVLKRVAVPDKESLRGMRTEVETMKRLKGHRPIVSYIDSHASEMRGGGYEVFLLMEYCDGGGLIDFMNTRLQHRLTEPEILNIFADIAEGVACMHYLKPALLHRDIKVENVLITTRSGGRRFMLCDFGSAAPPTPAPTSVVECRLMDEDVQKHTTLQYRSPEMVDVYRKQPLNEKADIWALGVFLYKLCFYTTPFEDQGQLAILNASYRFPSHPTFSDKLKRLIASMLREDLKARPNIYQVVAEACAMQGRKVPIPDIYSGRSSSAPPPKHQREAPKPVVGVSVSAPAENKEKLPDITPMRRGRPTASPAPAAATKTPAKRVTDGDPFAALDSKPSGTAKPAAASDDISDRFPSLNQFSLLHHKGSKFDFDPKSPTSPKPLPPPKNDMADKLADSAFAASRQAAASPMQLERPRSVAPVMTRTSSEAPATPSTRTPTTQPTSVRPVSIQPLPLSSTTSRYVSTGTMTSDSPVQRKAAPVNKLPQYVQDKPIGRSASVAVRPTGAAASNAAVSRPQARPETPETPTLNVRGYSDFNASRPRPISTSYDSRQQSLSDRSRPSTQAISTEAIRPPSREGFDNSSSSKANGQDSRGSSSHLQASSHNIQPNDRPQDGAFGNAFNKFEQKQAPAEEPKQVAQGWKPPTDVAITTTIVAAGAESSDDDDDVEMSPEMRRERERLQLEEEEQRVAAAQSEYRHRLVGAAQGKKPAPGPKPSTIQNRMKAYMGEEQNIKAVQRTAEGYGKYADAAAAASKPKPEIKRKPVLSGVARSSTMPQSAASTQKPDIASNASAPSLTGLNKPTPRPPPKKPEYLNSIPSGAGGGRSLSPVKNRSQTEREHLVAEDFPGQPTLEWSEKDKADYIDDFSKRFPSLSAMEGSSAGR